MTQKQKTPLFKRPFLLITILIVLLTGFFILALNGNLRFFLFIAVLLFITVLLLFSRHSRFHKELTDIRLKKEHYHEQINLLTQEIEKEEMAKRSLFERVALYAKLKSFAEDLSLSATRQETIRIITKKTDELFGGQGETVLLYLLHPKTGEFGLACAVRSGAKVNILLKKGDLFDRWVIKNLKPLISEDTKTDFRFDHENNKSAQSIERPTLSLISTPLVVGEKVLGILRIDSDEKNHFAMEDLRFLSRIADLGGVALESAELYEHIQDLAIKDGLTGLYLRRYLIERMSEELPRQLKRKKELSFFMMDLDDFKKYNDRFGHIAGDIVLRNVAEILIRNFKRPGNIICRYGGEEFAVMLPDCSQQEAYALAENFRREVEAAEITLRRERTKITISIGGACFPSQAQMKDELIHKADQALYAAKKKGKNQVCFL